MTTITVDRALLEQALEALEACYSPEYDGAKIHSAKLAIRTELAKPQADPVAASGEDLEIYREMANNYFKSTTPQHDAPETIALKAERDALEKDAKRYQWLRYGNNDEKVLRQAGAHYWYLLRNEKLDTAIDAAIDAAIAKAEGGAA